MMKATAIDNREETEEPILQLMQAKMRKMPARVDM